MNCDQHDPVREKYKSSESMDVHMVVPVSEIYKAFRGLDTFSGEIILSNLFSSLQKRVYYKGEENSSLLE